MSDHFEARALPAIRAATVAFVDQLTNELLPALQTAARGCGYAIAIHGSRARDIDLVAVPWTAQADSADFLLERLLGAMAGIVGRALVRQFDAGNGPQQWKDKPHGRKAVLIYLPGMCPEIDLSVMPRLEEAAK